MPCHTSLQSLTEPAYVLLGGLLPLDGSGEVKILRSPTEVIAYPDQVLPILIQLSVLRSHSDAVCVLKAWGGDEADLDVFVEQRLLIRFPAGDEPSIRGVLAPMSVWVPGDAIETSDGETVLVPLNSARAVVIGRLTAAVLDAPAVRSLGDGVAAVASCTGLDLDAVWTEVIVDLTAILSAGVGHLALTSAAPEQSGVQ